MTDEVEKMTFPMSRVSEAASRLKAIASDILPLSDEVLLEYVTVLVCNGKNQSQVREDLEAFLGEKSEEFVACLWKLLVKKFSPGKQKNSASERKSTVDFSSCGSLITQGSRRRKHNETTISASLPIDDVEANVIPRVKNMKVLREEFINSPPRKLQRSQVISAIKQPYNTKPDKYEQEFVEERSGILQNRPYSPVRDIRRLHSHYSPSGGSGISRVSVWDRLSRRPTYHLVLDDEYPTMPDFGPQPHENEVLHHHRSSFPAAYEHIQKFQREVPEVGCRYGIFQSHDKTIASTELHMGSSFSRKRRYGINNPNLGDASAGEFSTVIQRKQPKLLSSQSKKPHLLSELQNVKQKLQQLEMQLIQSKQSKKQKYEELNPSSQSGKLQYKKDETTESRIIHVTNVHYAASKEVISMLFSKCGAVKNVTIVTDPVILKPKGAAFVTFATEESVNKAIALSGTMFYSRPIQVTRYVIAAGVPPPQCQLQEPPREKIITALATLQ